MNSLCVVLVSPRNPLNIGAAARAMSNFGLDDLRLVSPYDLAFREARSAAGGASVLQAARVFPSLDEALDDRTLVVGSTAIGHRAVEHPLLPLPDGARRIRRGARTALLFGSEKFGLSNEDMSHCHWLLNIPTAATNESMNLGQAVAVCLYEITRGLRGRAIERPGKPVTANDLEQITRMMIEAARLSGYAQELTTASTELKLRRMVRRLHLRAADAAICLGLFRQVLWSLRRTPE